MKDRLGLACDITTRIHPVLLTHRGQNDIDDVLVCTSHRHLHGNSISEGEARTHQHVITSPEHTCTKSEGYKLSHHLYINDCFNSEGHP